MKAKIITISNQKGGVGKTTTAINIAAAFSLNNFHTLLIDMDPQSHCGRGLGLAETPESLHSGTVLLDRGQQLEKAILTTSVDNLEVLPAHESLVQIEKELFQRRGREWLLSRAIANIRDNYHYIIIDTPPNVGLLTENALCASEFIIIPCQMSYYALEATASMLNTLQQLREDLDHHIHVLGVLPTFYDKRTKTSDFIISLLREQFGEYVFQHWIGTNTKLNEAQKQGKVIFKYSPSSRGSKDYSFLAKEILRRLQRFDQSKVS